MRATILPKAIILAKECFVAQVQPLRCFLCLLPNYINFCATIMQYFSYSDKREVLQPPILPSPHFRWVVNSLF